MIQNKVFMYNSIPDGWPKSGRDLSIESTEFDVNSAPPEGGFVTRNLYATFDPAQRSMMRDPSIKSYGKAMEAGKPLMATTIVARILKSDAMDFKEGDLVLMMSSPTEEYSVVRKDKLGSVGPLGPIGRLQPTQGIPLTAYVGALGWTGLTAYGGLYEIGQPKKGETIVVSGAAGAVGHIVGQIALREGLKVIGSVGSDEKLEFITQELGFTAGFNYKKERPGDALDRLAPDGIDIYFDNVGGELLDESMIRMNEFGRIVACGTVSQYNNKAGEAYGVKNYSWINRKRIRYQGFIAFDKNIMKHAEHHVENITAWLLDGSFKSVEHVVDGGMDQAIDGFLGVFKGENVGRTVLKIADP